MLFGFRDDAWNFMCCIYKMSTAMQPIIQNQTIPAMKPQTDLQIFIEKYKMQLAIAAAVAILLLLK